MIFILNLLNALNLILAAHNFVSEQYGKTIFFLLLILWNCIVIEGSKKTQEDE